MIKASIIGVTLSTLEIIVYLLYLILIIGTIFERFVSFDASTD